MMDNRNIAPDSTSFYRKRFSSTVCFTLAVLLFFLPFAEFKCGGMTILENSGIGIATGRPWKPAMNWGKDQWTENLRDAGKSHESLLKDDLNIFALAALAAGLFGIAVSFARVSWRSTAGMCAGILGAAMLIALMIQFRIQLHSALSGKEKKEAVPDLDMGGIIRLQFSFWYFLSLAAFLAGAFLDYMRDKMALRDAMARAVDFEFQEKLRTPGPAK